MATLASLLTDVYALTNRPDLVTQSTVAVKAATLKAHQSDNYARDLVQGSFNFADPSLYVQTFNMSTLTRWRIWSYLQNFSPTLAPSSLSQNIVFDVIAPNDLFDDYQALKQNVCWQLGLSLNLRASIALPTLYYGYFQNQDLTNAADMGWISDSHPYAIIFDAARTVFKTIGYDEEASVYDALVKEQYLELKAANIVVVTS